MESCSTWPEAATQIVFIIGGTVAAIFFFRYYFGK